MTNTGDSPPPSEQEAPSAHSAPLGQSDESEAHDGHPATSALRALSSAAGHADRSHPAPEANGAVAGYRQGRTLRLAVELRRQLRRRRTRWLFILVAALPFVLVAAFAIGKDQPTEDGGGYVDLATSSAPNFVVFALFVSGGFLLPVIVALLFGDTIASEGAWSSLKYLLALPVPRGRLLRQKALSSALLSALAVVLLPVMSLVVGIVCYGPGPAVSPAGESIPFDRGMLALLFAVIYILIQLSWIAGLALLLSVSMDAPLGAVGGAVLLSIVSDILNQITALGGWRDVLPTHFAFAWVDVIAKDIDWTDMATGALSAVCYATVFGLLATHRFYRKDITS